MKKIDVIVPCFNEAPRVGKVLKVLSSFPYVKKIIVVDDGSTDNSSEVASKFPKVTLIKLPENIGKGGAVKEGLKKVDTATVFLSDADLKGFREDHVRKLINEYYEKDAEAAIGIPKTSNNRLWYFLRIHFLARVDGERIVKSKDLEKVVRSENSDRFGLEAWMNYYFRRKNIKPILVPLHGLRNGNFLERNELKKVALEAYDLGETYFEIYKDTLEKALT